MTLNCRGAGARGVEKLDWIRNLRRNNNVQLLCGQESQLFNPLVIPFSSLWGNSHFVSEAVGACGRSGGLFCLWDPASLNCMQVEKDTNFILISGMRVGLDARINFVNVYGSRSSVERKIFLGDFNETSVKEDRLPVSGCDSDIAEFNNFILAAGLSKYHMGGRRFTWMNDDGCHLSKIDRILVCENFLAKWPTGSVTALPRDFSDHCPLLFSTKEQSLENIVVRPWSSGRPSGSKELNLMRKLKSLKWDIKGQGC
ncbi:uncharacterized protein LOC143597315 [Bidens hawaiensis]|uniref:uncharacterized protein LOC143597315 n=1 Tax=Bidens hawaiensis TaxID=980011 RepID=UPI00404A5E7D